MSYNAYEVFEIADNLEIAGGAFYRKAAEKVQDEGDVKKLLNDLADMEEAHQSYFQTLREKYKVEEIDGLIDLESQAGAYLKVIGETHAMHSLSNVLDEGELTARRVLEVAINFEKDSVVFFSSLQAALIDDSEKEHVGQIVREESEHVGMLTIKLQELDK